MFIIVHRSVQSWTPCRLCLDNWNKVSFNDLLATFQLCWCQHGKPDDNGRIFHQTWHSQLHQKFNYESPS